MITRTFSHAALAAALVLAPLTPAMAQTAAPAAASDHARRVPIDGSNNFRDIGGYATADGHHVRWGVLYRSASLSGITPKGFAQLAALGLKTEIDFRSSEERKSDPNVWPAGMTVATYADDYHLPMDSFMTLFKDGNVTAEKTEAGMTAFYRTTPFQFASQYKRMFRQIADGNMPLVYHCSAGKDRTGVATALVLRLLGVPRETIVADYLLTNQYYVPQMPANAATDPQMQALAKLPPQVLKPLMAAEPGYINAALDAIDQRDGGWDRYVHEDLGLSEADIATLKTRLLD